jgi:hypothetical protein
LGTLRDGTLLDNGAEIKHLRRGYMVLQKATINDKLEIVNLLLARSCVGEAEERYQSAALREAIRYGSYSSVKPILETGFKWKEILLTLA